MKEQGQFLGEPRGLLQSRFPEPPHEQTGTSPQGWCNIDACVMAEEKSSVTPQLLLKTWRSSATFAPNFFFPRPEPPLPALFLLVSQLSSLSIPHFLFYFSCLLYTSTFFLYPILWVIPLHFILQCFQMYFHFSPGSTQSPQCPS